MAQSLNQVPPNLEVWDVQGARILVKVITDVSPPIYLYWHVEDDNRAQALGITGVDRSFSSWDEFARTGALHHGGTIELVNTTVDPWKQIKSNYASEVRVKPWLADPEILNLWIAAAYEGRGITEAEFQGTEWWRTHTEAERQWLSLNASDPATAASMISDNRIRVADLLAKAGVDNASPGLVEAIADNWTQGAWTEAYAIKQIQYLADPQRGGVIDPAIRELASGLDTTRAREDTVESLISVWLGPAYSSNWSPENIASWASRFRQNPDDARVELEAILKQHRLALFPEYTNPNLTYEDIAAPWRGVWTQEWGATPDEMSPLFTQIVRANNLDTARTILRKEGLKQGNQNVTERMLSDLNQVFGGEIRPPHPAVL